MSRRTMCEQRNAPRLPITTCNAKQRMCQCVPHVTQAAQIWLRGTSEAVTGRLQEQLRRSNATILLCNAFPCVAQVLEPCRDRSVRVTSVAAALLSSPAPRGIH